jgi:hypothetical protein
MSDAELLASALQIAYFAVPTLVGALIGFVVRRGGRGAGVGAAVGFVLGATAWAVMAVR